MAEHSVQRLKELLFEQETRELGDLSRRLDAVFERAGTENRFRSSVADVIDGALRDAEVARHRELADAISPLVVRTVRTEINASQDLLVEALYPKTGELVRRYVASAMRDLVDDLNRRLESSLPLNRWLLKVKSLFTGRSMAELAIAEAHAFAVEDLYLVRRGSGELVEHWSRPGGAAAPEGDDAVFGSVLAAITGFTDHALHGEEGALRTLEVGDQVLYVRASPAHLLAARCRSAAPPSIEQALDEELLKTLASRQGEAQRRQSTGDDPDEPGSSVLAPLAERLEETVRAKRAGLARGPSPLKVLAILIIPPLLALAVWQGWIAFNTWSTRQRAEAALSETQALGGYPVRIDVERGGGAVYVSGLSPSPGAKDQFLDRLRLVVPEARIVDRLASLPVPATAIDPRPQIDAVKGDVGALRKDVGGTLGRLKDDIGALEARMRRAGVLDRIKLIERRLADVGRDLDRLAGGSPEGTAQGMAGEGRDLVRAALAEVGALARSEPEEGRIVAVLNGAIARLRQAVQKTGVRLDNVPPPRAPGEAAAELLRLSELLAASVGRLEAMGSLGPLEKRIAELAGELERLKARPIPSPPPPPPGPDARERLARAVREHSVFFGNGIEYRDDAAAVLAIDAIVAAMAGYDGVLRVVGFTDERGKAADNLPLAQSRAQRVAQALEARGVPRTRLVVIGRVTGSDISGETGETSPNRRVSFEVGFRGEVP